MQDGCRFSAQRLGGARDERPKVSGLADFLTAAVVPARLVPG